MPLPAQALILALAAWLPVLAPAAPAGPAAPRGDVLLERPDGEVLRVDGATFSTADPRELGAVLVRYEGLRPPERAEQPGAALVELAAGGRVHGRVLGGEGEELHLELVGGPRLPLLVEEITRLSFPGRVPRGWTGRIEPAETGDRVYFLRGSALDRLDGTLLAFDADGLKVDSSIGVMEVAWRDVAVVLVAELGEGLPPPAQGTRPGVPVVVDLTDGSRLPGELLRMNGSEVDLRTPGGRGVRLPASIVAEVFVDDGRLVFLSELPPSEVEEGSPFGDDLGLTWPHRRDRSAGGGALTSGGRRWSRGLGVHSPSRLTWELDGSWLALRGHAGIDDEVLRLPGRGSVRFRVLVYGEERFASGVVRGGEPPLALPEIDLRGATKLTLEVEMADELHVADRANWLGVRLVRPNEE